MLKVKQNNNKLVKPTAQMGQKSQWGSVKPDNLELTNKQKEKKERKFH